jgi:AhpD family alkylhydroperoxidase
MQLTFKEKELVNIGASVATGCKPCTDYHFKKVREAGASDEDIKQAISDAMLVRDSAKQIMESHGLKHLGIIKEIDNGGFTGSTTRIKELVSIGAAFAVNCTSNLERHTAAARSVGITDDEISSVLDAALFIKGEAAFYVDQIAKLKERNIQLQQLLDELRATQAQLVQSEKMAALGKLVAGLVHEINTPVGAINSAADVSRRSVAKILDVLDTSRTLDDTAKRSQLQDSLKALQNIDPVTAAATERITKIVTSLKSFSRLDEAALQKIDLHDCLETTLTLIEHDLGDRIDVMKDYGDIPQVLCYPGELNQVFINLLTNGIQAVKGSGTITIRTFEENENVHVKIADTGVGIPADQVQHLFDPGFSKKGVRVKAGMGLFISYNIVQKHGGQLNVESEVGKGSTFTITLPTDFEKQSEAPDKPDSSSPADRCSRLET